MEKLNNNLKQDKHIEHCALLYHNQVTGIQK